MLTVHVMVILLFSESDWLIANIAWSLTTCCLPCSDLLFMLPKLYTRKLFACLDLEELRKAEPHQGLTVHADGADGTRQGKGCAWQW